MRHTFLIALGLACFICCCSTKNASSSKHQMDAKIIETRVFYGECFVRTQSEILKPKVPAPVAAIAAVIVPKLISEGLDRTGDALRKAGEEDTVTFLGHLNFDLPPDKTGSCIQIVRGLFSQPSDAVKGPLIKVPDMSATEVDRLKEINIHLADKPQLFLELRVRKSTDGSALSLAPSHLEYNVLLKTGTLPRTPPPKEGLLFR